MADELPLEVEAALEVTRPESKPKAVQRRGPASLRGVKRTTYMRRSLLRMASKSPEDLEAYSPANGFELLAKQMLTLEGSARVAAMQVWREVKETLGERVGSRNKDTIREERWPRIISDLIRPDDDKEKVN